MRGSTAERTSKTMKTNAETTQNEATAAAVAEQGAPSAPEQATSTKGASHKKGAPKAKKGAKKSAAKKEAKPASKPAAKKEAKAASKKAAKAAAPKADGQPRDGSKKAIVIAMLTTKDGATLAAIMKVTDWKKHSIRGFISGNLMKKMDLPVDSFKNEAGERTYRIAK